MLPVAARISSSDHRPFDGVRGPPHLKQSLEQLRDPVAFISGPVAQISDPVAFVSNLVSQVRKTIPT
jgi:hypothetical protein